MTDMIEKRVKMSDIIRSLEYLWRNYYEWIEEIRFESTSIITKFWIFQFHISPSSALKVKENYPSFKIKKNYPFVREFLNIILKHLYEALQNWRLLLDYISNNTHISDYIFSQLLEGRRRNLYEVFEDIGKIWLKHKHTFNPSEATRCCNIMTDLINFIKTQIVKLDNILTPKELEIDYPQLYVEKLLKKDYLENLLDGGFVEDEMFKFFKLWIKMPIKFIETQWEFGVIKKVNIITPLALEKYLKLKRFKKTINFLKKYYQTINLLKRTIEESKR